MKFFLVGIKGSGMASLALLLNSDGYQVEGADVENYIYTETRLKQNHIHFYPLNKISNLKGCFVIIGHSFMTPPFIEKLEEEKIPFLEYHQFLDFYISHNNLISICGSHGKTTLTGLLHQAYVDSSTLRGDGYGLKRKNEKYFFLESCEYQDHFLKYHPKFILITNIDYDHVDYFKDENMYQQSFQSFAKKAQIGLVNYEDKDKIKNPNYFTYGLTSKADFYVKNEKVDESGIQGELYFQSEKITYFHFQHLYGEPLLKDVIATLAFGYLHHENMDKAIQNILNFQMPNKRFNTIKLPNNNIIINDYAHHPSQIKENLKTIKRTYQNYRYVGFYRPDRESRLRYFRQEFINSLEKFDQAFLVDHEDHRFRYLLKDMENNNVHYLEKEEQIEYFKNKSNYVFLIMSSKNMDEVINKIKILYEKD